MQKKKPIRLFSNNYPRHIYTENWKQMTPYEIEFLFTKIIDVETCRESRHGFMMDCKQHHSINHNQQTYEDEVKYQLFGLEQE